MLLICPGPGCDGKILGTVHYDPRIGQMVGDGRARSHDVDDAGDGRALWWRYRCRGCHHESVWPANLLEREHYRAVGDGRTAITYRDVWVD